MSASSLACICSLRSSRNSLASIFSKFVNCVYLSKLTVIHSHDTECLRNKTDRTREASASPTTISRHAAAYATNARFVASTNARFVAFLGTYARPSRRFGCQATTSMIPPPGAPPPSVRSSTCTQHFCRTTTARSSLQRTCPHRRHSRAAAPRPTQAHHHNHRTRADRTPAHTHTHTHIHTHAQFGRV